MVDHMKQDDTELAASVCRAFGHDFNDTVLAVAAVTHSSYVHENLEAGSDNERLEFLGDAVIGLAVAEMLSGIAPGAHEGSLTRRRAAMVNASALAQAARRIKIGPLLRLGQGEESSGGRDKNSILADAFEALCGAVFIDAGYIIARELIVKHLSFLLGRRLEKSDAKSRLQELLQSDGRRPVYQILEENGPDHLKEFEVVIFFSDDPDKVMGRGKGRSKKEAEQDAAARALESLDQEE